jgi:hypothetical protein
MITTVFAGTFSENLEKTQTTLFLSLENPEPTLRLIALERLQAILNSGSELENDQKEFVKNALLNRLNDDNDAIVSAALEMSLEHNYFEPKQLFDICSNIIEKSQDFTVRTKAVTLLHQITQQNPDLMGAGLDNIVSMALLTSAVSISNQGCERYSKLSKSFVHGVFSHENDEPKFISEVFG